MARLGVTRVATMGIVQRVAIDLSEVVSGANDAVVNRRVVIPRHNKVKGFSRTSAGPKQDFLIHATTTQQQLKHPKLEKL